MKREQRKSNTYMSLNIDEIYAGRSGIQEDMSLTMLAASIARHGLLQPVVVRQDMQTGRYQLVCGGRRLLACRMLGMRHVDAVVLPCSAQEAAACRLEEHWTRNSPCFVDEAAYLAACGADAVKAHFALPDNMIDERIRMLDLPEQVRRKMALHSLSLDQAKPVLGIRGEDRQLEAVHIIAQRSLTPAQCRRLVNGPERSEPDQNRYERRAEKQRSRQGRRRVVSSVIDAISDAVDDLRAKGFPVQLLVQPAENGVSFRIVMKNEEPDSVLAGKRQNDIE